jgi:hypothetical protein
MTENPFLVFTLEKVENLALLVSSRLPIKLTQSSATENIILYCIVQ